jgi:hypothetical protein
MRDLARYLMFAVAVAGCATAAAPPPPSNSGPATTAPTPASTPFTSDASDPLAEPATLHDGTPRRPMKDLQAALELARARLKTLDRYRSWQREHWRYKTTVGTADNGHVYVGFDVPMVTDQDITIEIDVDAHAVVNVSQGEA